MGRRQGIFWILTIPQHCFTPYLPNGCSWIRGQLECGETEYLHWQIIVAFGKKVAVKGVRSTFGPYHAELTRSEAAADYVWKEATKVEGTRFELGAKPFQRNSRTDWERVWQSAVAGDLMAIPANVRVVSYRTLRAIAADHATPTSIIRNCRVFWGPTGTGKSRRAWEEAGMEAYCKDPRSKFWDGYRNQVNVVMDEFRGGIDISHLLRWLDRYPVRVEIKGSSRPLMAQNIWITSNLDPRCWYPDLDNDTLNAMLRRMSVEYFS
jgi:hypothetical protein